MSDSHSMSHPIPHDHRYTITADGKCDKPINESGTQDETAPLDLDNLDNLEIIIDGNTITAMTGDANSPTLLGSDPAFLPASEHFSLCHFEPLPDGRCLLRYRKKC